MTNRSKTVDLDAAIVNPAANFDSPMAVARDAGFTKDEKLRILESWVRDAQLLSQAETENMAGDERPRLQEAKLALFEVQEQD